MAETAMAGGGQLVIPILFVFFFSLISPSEAHFGSCEDHTSQCPIWAQQGACRSNFVFMIQNCPVSCNTCLDPRCFDRNRMCSLWASQGACTIFRKQMLATCPHSCDACFVPTIPVPPTAGISRTPSIIGLPQQTITNPDFECGQGTPTTSTSNRINSDTVLFPDDPLLIGTRTRNNNNNNNRNNGRRHSRSVVLFPDDPLLTQARTRNPNRRNPHDDHVQPSMSMRMIPAGDVNSVSSSNISVLDTFCGATPITDRFLLTAAHCVTDPEMPVRSVRLGELDFSKANEAKSQPVDYEIQTIYVHQNFSLPERYNDIAVIETKETIQFNEFVFPLCVPAIRPSAGAQVTGAGFGFVNSTVRASRLQEAELKIVDSSECESRYIEADRGPNLRLFYPQMIQGQDILCAAFPGRDACEGDSGGPLFQEDNSGRRFLVGIVGSGITCRGNMVSVLPGFYISVADHIDFIDSVIYGI